MLEELAASILMVPACQTMWCHNPGKNMNLQCCKNLKYYIDTVLLNNIDTCASVEWSTLIAVYFDSLLSSIIKIHHSVQPMTTVCLIGSI